MIRGLNSIHAQALDPKTASEKKSFAGYVLCWTEFTHHHHAGVLYRSAIKLIVGRKVFISRV